MFFVESGVIRKIWTVFLWRHDANLIIFWVTMSFFSLFISSVNRFSLILQRIENNQAYYHGRDMDSGRSLSRCHHLGEPAFRTVCFGIGGRKAAQSEVGHLCIGGTGRPGIAQPCHRGRCAYSRPEGPSDDFGFPYVCVSRLYGANAGPCLCLVRTALRSAGQSV